LRPDQLAAWRDAHPGAGAAWSDVSGYKAEEGQRLLLPDSSGGLAGVLLGLGATPSPLAWGALPGQLPAGDYRIASDMGGEGEADLAALSWALGAYEFNRYRKSPPRDWPRLVLPDGVDLQEASLIAAGVHLARDLINIPANDMGPDALAAAAHELSATHGAQCHVTQGDALLAENHPLIHAVGRASANAPRLIDIKWGDEAHPKVTLVGKGVCFDTGGLNLKPGNAMALMKKDMGGAANVLGLASMIMTASLPVRLRVLIPAVENAVSGNAFRPGDILQSRKGVSVEIGNTDAEGRLVLADALALADEEPTDLLIDLATLTGAARVALGPDLPPYFTKDEALAEELEACARQRADPLWRLPLWAPYDAWLESKVADINHISDGPFAGSITAALFLSRFVEQAAAHVHIDIYGWTPKPLPGRPMGGEAQTIRALYSLIKKRFSA